MVNGRHVGDRAGGMTLVELLVALAIVAVMAAVAVPTFSRLGLFSDDPVRNGGRELYAMLQGAKARAATYNVKTAVVYHVVSVKDSITDQDVQVASHVAVVEEEPRGSGVFVPVDNRYGAFNPMVKNSCVWLNENLGDGTFEFITVGFPDTGETIELMPAHVFLPSGLIQSDESVARISFEVRDWPEADRVEREAGEDGELRAARIDLYTTVGRIKLAS